MTNVGKWDAWYAGLSGEPPGAFRYADTVTYLMAAAFMADVAEVEDWGCGAGGFKRFCKSKYIGIDGSKTPFADKYADLTEYTSNVDGIVIRHVLEHDHDWEQILVNAVRSFRRKLCVVLFTPFTKGALTEEIAHNRQHGVDVPDLALPQGTIEHHLEGHPFVLYDNLPTGAAYGVEHVYLVWRRDD